MAREHSSNAARPEPSRRGLLIRDSERAIFVTQPHVGTTGDEWVLERDAEGEGEGEKLGERSICSQVVELMDRKDVE